MLDRVICDLATAVRADAVVYKVRGGRSVDRPLLKLGYHRVPTPPMHFFEPVFENFRNVCGVGSRYRHQINQSRRKLSDGGLKIVVLSDPHAIMRAYTSEVHALYHQMADKAAMKVEVLPIEFHHCCS